MNKNIEIMDFKFLLGLSYVYFYNLSAPRSFNRMIKRYESAGLLEVIQIYTPEADQTPSSDSDQRLQQAAMLDVVLRSMGEYRYLINMDLDELIVPRPYESFDQMYEEYFKTHPASDYIFLNAFFRVDFEDDPCVTYVRKKNRTAAKMELRLTPEDLKYCVYLKNISSEAIFLLTARKTAREVEIYPPKIRSKNIIHTEDAYFMGTHYVLHFWKNRNRPYKELQVVPKEVSLLHHYREWRSKAPQVRDRVIYRFLPKLAKQLSDNLKVIPETKDPINPS